MTTASKIDNKQSPLRTGLTHKSQLISILINKLTFYSDIYFNTQFVVDLKDESLIRLASVKVLESKNNPILDLDAYYALNSAPEALTINNLIDLEYYTGYSRLLPGFRGPSKFR